MTQLTKRENIAVIQALSNAHLPKDILEKADIYSIIRDVTSSQAKVEKSNKNLADARKEQKKGNVISNWWHNREDNIKDAHLSLSEHVADLSKNSSRLLIVNTAISKILLEQQEILHKQQDELHRQTLAIQAQNERIYKQQNEIQDAHKILAEQQIEINAANEGLMKAKGITSEHAAKLVTVVQDTEKLFDNAKLLENKLKEAVENIYFKIHSSNEETSKKITNELEKNKQDFNDLVYNQQQLLSDLHQSYIQKNQILLREISDIHQAYLKNFFDKARENVDKLGVQYEDNASKIRKEAESWFAKNNDFHTKIQRDFSSFSDSLNNKLLEMAKKQNSAIKKNTIVSWISIFFSVGVLILSIYFFFVLKIAQFNF